MCWLWGELCQWGGVPDLLRGAVLCLLPAAVTGGIHLDGYCDTVDALASHGTPARRQEILKDPHIGAFGVIRGIVCWKSLAGGAMVLAALLVFWDYWRRSRKYFGGLSGDLAGWFLQRVELWMLAAVWIVEWGAHLL